MIVFWSRSPDPAIAHSKPMRQGRWKKRYLVEIKSSKGTAQTSLRALKERKADRLLYLKGNTKGGQDGNILTLPLFCAVKQRHG